MSSFAPKAEPLYLMLGMAWKNVECETAIPTVYAIRGESNAPTESERVRTLRSGSVWNQLSGIVAAANGASTVHPRFA